MEQVLGGFRPAEQVVDSYNAYYDYEKMVWEDTGDLDVDENTGEPIWAGYRTDLRNVAPEGKKTEVSTLPFSKRSGTGQQTE